MMLAKMRIQGWTARGFRCPDHELDFQDDVGRIFPVTLIQMPNGTGKTTTLNLLRAALAGPSLTSKWRQQTVREFRKRDSQQPRGEFELKLTLNGRLVTIMMTFDFESGRVLYKTTRGDGQVLRFDPPSDFQRFMNQDFVNFFVFDGELAQNLLSHEDTNAEAVVEHLFQIGILDAFASKIHSFWHDTTLNASATERKGLTRRHNRVVKLQARLEQLKIEQRDFVVRRERIEARIAEQRRLYEESIQNQNSFSDRLEQAKQEQERSKSLVQEQSQGVLDAMADPHALSSIFAESIFQLKAGLDRVKLPESAAREFFEELAQEDECICGREIDDAIRDVIRERAARYLGSDDVTLLNSLKTDINEAVGISREDPELKLQAQLSELTKLVDNEIDARNELDLVNSEAEQRDPEIRKIADDIRNLETRLKTAQAEEDKYNSNDDTLPVDSTYGISVMEQWLIDAEQKLAEITRTLELKQKRDILSKIMTDAHTYAKRSISAEICREANVRIDELLPYNNIHVDRIDKCLVLHGQEGGSVGEQLSIGYAFLSTLFNRSEHQLPFVVDSPAGPIDLAVRPKIGELVPRLSGQFIAFTISSEREGFVSSLADALDENRLQYITMFRKGIAGLRTQARASNSYVETEDGYVVHDEEFFNLFQLDIEDA